MGFKDWSAGHCCHRLTRDGSSESEQDRGACPVAKIKASASGYTPISSRQIGRLVVNQSFPDTSALWRRMSDLDLN